MPASRRLEEGREKIPSLAQMRVPLTSWRMNYRLPAVIAFIALFSAVHAADEPKSKLPPDFFSAPARTVEQRFQDADVSLAIAQYEKLRTMAFELRLQLQFDPPADDKKRDELAIRAETLHMQATELRDATVKRAVTAAR